MEFVPVLSPGNKKDHTEIRENAFVYFKSHGTISFFLTYQLESDISVYGDGNNLVRVKSYVNNVEQNTGSKKIYSVLDLNLDLP